jgi:hypothetical protein
VSIGEDRYKTPGKEAKSADGISLGNIREMDNRYVLTDGEPNFYIPRYTESILKQYSLLSSCNILESGLNGWQQFVG